ncbi:hypothetical protein TNCT_246881 [Trichonephila clavata]|uniref:Uncharacterized protein n=1 Tax=Trichonephila clavata TaxID=2740835 RepID=A0A8X6J9L0_TRICU|nr:hypothetical protein TNCT_246881 [Trichonephila clavata]
MIQTSNRHYVRCSLGNNDVRRSLLSEKPVAEIRSSILTFSHQFMGKKVALKINFSMWLAFLKATDTVKFRFGVTVEKKIESVKDILEENSVEEFLGVSSDLFPF